MKVGPCLNADFCVVTLFDKNRLSKFDWKKGVIVKINIVLVTIFLSND